MSGDRVTKPIRNQAAPAAAQEARGEILYRARRIVEAEHQLERAIALGGDPQRTIEMRWMCAMLRGDFERAWRISDDVLRRGGAEDASDLPRHLRRVWNGAPLAARVLVRCYHGLGDAIQFIRFVPRIAEVARSVAVEAQAELIPLLRSMPEISTLVPLGEQTPAYDVAIEAMEIPHALRVTLPTVPRTVPYLAVPRDARDRARRILAKIPGDLKVGLVWKAGQWRPERSAPLHLVARLAEIPGVALVNLQRGQTLDDDDGIFSFSSTSDEMIDVAALVAELDLVVTVDTMMAHLAGSLARPVWTLLHCASDWRWMLDRTTSPWYPTMRLFRQTVPGGWDTVSAEVCDELALLSMEGRGPTSFGERGAARPLRRFPNDG
jgi:hypothetical protein